MKMQWFMIQMLIFLVGGHYANNSFTIMQTDPFMETAEAPSGGQHLLRMQNGATGPFNLPVSL